jgi:hypothetical protein
MKILILMILLFSVAQAFSQFGKKKKAKKEASQAQAVDANALKIDSLTVSNTALYAKLDSVTKNEQLYYGLYITIKEKVLLHDFDPTRLGLIIDSIRATSSAPDKTTSPTTAALTTVVEPLGQHKDSLFIMNHQNKLLTAKVDSMAVAIQTLERKNTDKLWLVSELKDLKGLLDTKLISQSDYESKKKQVMDKWQ